MEQQVQTEHLALQYKAQMHLLLQHQQEQYFHLLMENLLILLLLLQTLTMI